MGAVSDLLHGVRVARSNVRGDQPFLVLERVFAALPTQPAVEPA